MRVIALVEEIRAHQRLNQTIQVLVRSRGHKGVSGLKSEQAKI